MNELPTKAECGVRALIIFARLPVPGKVKTRLAAGLGKDAACQFYKACAEHVVEESARCDGVRRYLFYSEKEDKAKVARWMKDIGQDKSLELRAQEGGGDVGERMSDAFQVVFAEGACQAVVIGTDVPDLSAPIVMAAFAALNRHEVVFGPARDGGYYLVGTTAVRPPLFQGIPWSTPQVLGLSVGAAQQAGIQVAPLDSLPCLFDIDTVQDLEAWLGSSSMLRTTNKGQGVVRSLNQGRGVIAEDAEVDSAIVGTRAIAANEGTSSASLRQLADCLLHTKPLLAHEETDCLWK